MPNIRCSVPTCTNNNYYKNKEHKFYSFPRDSNRQKLWMQMIGRVDLDTGRDISKSYSICDVHFHPLMIEKGRLKEYALPVILVSSDSFIPTMHSVETQTFNLVHECCTQTDNVQLRDKNVQTNYIASFEKAYDCADKKDMNPETSKNMHDSHKRKKTSN